MSVAEVSRERVEQRLALLEEAFDSFPVNQTTLTVSAEAYERARERCREGLVDAFVRVHNDEDEVLLVDDDDGDRTVPRVEPGARVGLRAGARRAVRDRTGVDCAITDLERVTILGVRHEDDPDRNPVYRLVTVFTADRVGGDPDTESGWYGGVPESALPQY